MWELFQLSEEFVELDVGEIAADVIECVRESRQRYGMTMILSTLAGANTAKIRSAGMNELSVYGRQSKCSQQRLKDVVYTLLEHGYLQQSADRYAILKLTDWSEELLKSRELKLRCKKSELTEKRKSGSGKKASHRKERVSGILQIKAENYSKNCVLCVILWQRKRNSAIYGRFRSYIA